MASREPASLRATSHGEGPGHPSLLQATPTKNSNLNKSLWISRPLTCLRNVGFKPLRWSQLIKHLILLKGEREITIVIIQKLWLKFRNSGRDYGVFYITRVYFRTGFVCLPPVHMSNKPSRPYGPNLGLGQHSERGVLCQQRENGLLNFTYFHSP